MRMCQHPVRVLGQRTAPESEHRLTWYSTSMIGLPFSETILNGPADKRTEQNTSATVPHPHTAWRLRGRAPICVLTELHIILNSLVREVAADQTLRIEHSVGRVLRKGARTKRQHQAG
jgi:hypothetical protein